LRGDGDRQEVQDYLSELRVYEGLLGSLGVNCFSAYFGGVMPKSNNHKCRSCEKGMEMKQHTDEWTYYWCENCFSKKIQMRLKLTFSQRINTYPLDVFNPPTNAPWGDQK